MNKNETRIYLPLKAKLISGTILLVVGILLSACGIFDINSDDIIYQIARPIIIFAGVICFLVAIYYFVKCFSSKPIIVVNDDGVTDNSTLSSYGFIAWEDIESIEIRNDKGNVYILISVFDNEKYIQKLSWLSRFLANSNKFFGEKGSYLTTRGTDVELQDLLVELNKRLDSRK